MCTVINIEVFKIFGSYQTMAHLALSRLYREYGPPEDLQTFMWRCKGSFTQSLQKCSWAKLG